MPRYAYECMVYECGEFGKTIERDAPIADRNNQCCIDCGFPLVRAVGSAPAIKFKGKGWTPKFHPNQKGKK